MTWLDALPFVLVIGYGVGGYFTGVIRRLIGLVALYLAFIAASNMAPNAGGILQQSSSVPTPDSRIYAFFGIVVLVLVVIEAAGQLAHSTIQIQAIVFNRVSGAIIGVITGFLLAVVLTFEFQAAANPDGGGTLDGLQQNIRDAVHGSHIAVPLMKAVQTPVVGIFLPVLPPNPNILFSNGPIT